MGGQRRAAIVHAEVFMHTLSQKAKTRTKCDNKNDHNINNNNLNNTMILLIV